jgi:hypothetical protein
MKQQLFLTCQPSLFRSLLMVLETLLASEEEPVSLLDWGVSSEQGLVFVVLEWQCEVETALLVQLALHPLVADVCVYTSVQPQEAREALTRLRTSTALDELVAGKEGAHYVAQ